MRSLKSLTLIALSGLFMFTLLPATGAGAAGSKSNLKPGSLVQLAGKRGCVVDRSVRGTNCGFARGLKGPGPFMGSRAIALSPDGRQVYVASSTSNAITVFNRKQRRGTLKQPKGKLGCIAAKGASGCAKAIGLSGPNSLAMSRDGRNLYATSRNSSSITSFRRNTKTGQLTQLKSGSGCISGLPVPGCATGRALSGADVVVISNDGKSVYVGSFFGNAVATFNRNPATGKLTQPSDETGCLTQDATTGCAQGLALASPEGMAISKDGKNVYVATAVSNAVLSLSRNTSTGALTQASDGTGCVVNADLAGCTTGTEISGANAVAVSPRGGDVYVTSLISSSLTLFVPSAGTGSLTQPSARASCVVWLGDLPCTFGRAMRAPEGLVVSPDGRNVYTAAFSSGAIAVMDRDRLNGAIAQRAGDSGCIATNSIANCAAGRSMAGSSSIALSPDGRFVYSTAFNSNAVDIFRRVQRK